MASFLASLNEGIVYAFLFVLMYYQVFLLLTFFEKRRVLSLSHTLPQQLPSVTVLIPCFNEETTLDRTIQSVLNLNYPKEKLQIILINDGSTDSTPQVMDNYKNGYSNIHVFHKENGGKWRALNFGLDKVTTDLVGCLDADSFVDTEALNEIVKTFNTHSDAMAVTPSMRVWKPNTVVRKIQTPEYDLGIFVRKTLSFIGAIHITPGPFSIFKREVFQKIGPYKHAHNTEDFEIALRMQKAGMKIENAHKALVYTVGPATAYKLYRQRVRWVSGFMKNILDNRAMLLGRKYGHLSFFILPMALFAIVAALYFVLSTIISLVMRGINTAGQLSSVGWQFPQFNFNFDWFFFNTSIVTFVGITVIILTLSSIIFGRIIVKSSKILTTDLVWFFLLYSFISPFWLIKATYSTVMSKQTQWR